MGDAESWAFFYNRDVYVGRLYCYILKEIHEVATMPHTRSAPKARAYYIRPAHVETRGAVFDHSEKKTGTCYSGMLRKGAPAFSACPVQGAEARSRG